MQEGLLLYRNRLIIPETLRGEILKRLHTAHQGIVKCRALARDSVWWPKLSTQIEDMIKKCPVCLKEKPIQPEPLIPLQTPAFPWQKVGMDLFELKKEQYLLIVDYYSRFIEVANLKSTSAENVISHCKSIFSRHGIPEIVISDNGPQFTSKQFEDFARKYEFSHVTSSPYYPKSNGEAERAVQTVKAMLRKAEDPYLAMLTYRTTPFEQGLSPAELLFGRKIRGKVPMLQSKFSRHTENEKEFREKDKKQKRKQKQNYDRAHRTRNASPLQQGQTVWVKPAQTPGTVTKALPNRSYVVETPQGKQRRNRVHLIPRDPNPETPRPVPRYLSALFPNHKDNSVDSPHTDGEVVDPEDDIPTEPNGTPRPIPSSDPPVKRTSSGRIVRAPQRLDL